MRHLLLAVLIALAAPSLSKEKPVDMLDYFLQSDDRKNEWTIGGVDVQQSKDPDGTKMRTVILTKYSRPEFYEVFKITGNQIQLRYEVFRQGGKDGTRSWIRRFEEIGGEGPKPGAIWANRYMTPGKGILTHFRQEKYVFEEASRSYVLDKSACVERFPTWTWVTWENNDWRGNNRTGYDLARALRMVAEWQDQGLVYEMYDYAKGKGMVAWRWAEKFATLKPAEEDETGRVFRCENGHVWVKSRGSADEAPVVYKYDLKARKMDRRLEVVKFTSYWKKEEGPQWYVIYRDSTREQPLDKKMEATPIDFTLPEWSARPGSTIADLGR